MSSEICYWNASFSSTWGAEFIYFLDSTKERGE